MEVTDGQSNQDVVVTPAVLDGLPIVMTTDLLEVEFGSEFDPTVYASVADGCTLEVKGTELFVKDGIVSAVGNFQLEYNVLNQGTVVATRYCVVHIFDPSESVIKDHSFTGQDSVWKTNGNVSFAEGIAKLSSGSSVSQDGLSMETGNYSLTVQLGGTVTVELITDNFSVSKELSPDGNSFMFHISESVADGKLVISANADASVSEILIERENLSGDTTPPTIFGLVDRIVLPGTEVDILKDVTAVDDHSGSVTSTITITLPDGLSVIDGNITFDNEGEYVIVYTAYDDEMNSVSASRTFYVGDTLKVGHKLLNDDFENSDLANVYYDAYGASCTVEICEESDGNHCFALTVQTIPDDSHQPFPRLIFGNLVGHVYDHTLIFEQGCEYTLSYRIRHDQTDKTYRYQTDIGEVLEADPWVTYFTAGIYEPGTYWGYGDKYATDEWVTVSHTFKMEYDTTSMGSIIMGIGTGAEAGKNGGTAQLPITVYIDDFVLE